MHLLNMRAFSGQRTQDTFCWVLDLGSKNHEQRASHVCPHRISISADLFGVGMVVDLAYATIGSVPLGNHSMAHMGVSSMALL